MLAAGWRLGRPQGKEAGSGSQLDWLDAQRSQFAVQQAMVQTRLAYLQNQVALYKTQGGSATGAAMQP